MELFLILATLCSISSAISRAIILYDMHENYPMLNCEEFIQFHHWKYMIPIYNLYMYHNQTLQLEEEKETYLLNAYIKSKETKSSVKRTGAYEWEQEEEKFVELKPNIKTICIKGNYIQLFVNPNGLEKTVLLIPNKNDYEYEMDAKKEQINITQLRNQSPLYISCKREEKYRFLIQAKQFLLDYQTHTLEKDLKEITDETLEEENIQFSFQKTK